jgi:nicotinamide mononucleotide transporter
MDGSTWLEAVAAALGVISVWFVIKRRVLAFPIGIAMVSLYAYIFYTEKYYAGMALQVMFIVLQIWGWIQWKKGEHEADDSIVVQCCLSRRDWLLSAAAQVAGSLAIAFSLRAWTDAELPFLDATTTAMSVIAQWWMNRKQLQHWLIWIVVDVLYVVQTAFAEMWWTVGLYAVLLVQATVGYFEWRKALRGTAARPTRTAG